jgi:iron(III) transport system permease protein
VAATAAAAGAGPAAAQARRWAFRPDPTRVGLVAVAVLGSVTILALLATIVWLSVLDGSPGAAAHYSFGHYAEIFGDPFTYVVLWNTVQFAAVALVVAFAFALPIAWLIERTDMPGKPVVLALMTLSLLVPGFAVAIGWLFLLHPRIGLINLGLMQLLGLDTAPLTIASIPGMAVVEGLSLAPVAFLMLAASLRAMDPALEEAAAMSGAPLARTIRRVTLPVLLPSLVASGIYVVTIAFSAFDIPAIIGLPSRIFTFSTTVYYRLSPWSGTPTYGNVAVLSLVMVAIGIALTLLYARVQARGRRYAVLTGKAYRPRLVPLGRGRAIAIGFVTLYFLLAEAMPVAMLAWVSGLPYLRPPSAAALATLSLDNFRSVTGSLLWHALGNTAILMVAVPTLTVAVSAAFSWVALRSKIRGRVAFDVLAFLPHCIPTIIFSVAALLLTLYVLQGIVPLYGTITLLILVYAIARLSYGTRMTNTALGQIHADLDESAAAAGAGTAGVLRKVLLPLLAPAMLYAWIWISLLSYRELTLPVLLSGNTNKPLSVVVWSYLETSSYGEASAITVLMLLLLTPLVLLYWIVARRVGIAGTN